MRKHRLLGLALAAATVSLAAGCPSGTQPDPTVSPSAAASPVASPTMAPTTAPSPTPTPAPTATPVPAATPSPSPTPAASPSPTNAATVSFEDGMLSPSNVVINTSGTVTWTNDTDEAHSITPDELFTFRGTGEIEPGKSSRAVMFNGAGVKKYHCQLHPDETGTITVMEAVQ